MWYSRSLGSNLISTSYKLGGWATYFTSLSLGFSIYEMGGGGNKAYIIVYHMIRCNRSRESIQFHVRNRKGPLAKLYQQIILILL